MRIVAKPYSAFIIREQYETDIQLFYGFVYFSFAILQYYYFMYQAAIKRLWLDVYILSTIFVLAKNYLIFFMRFHILGSVDVYILSTIFVLAKNYLIFFMRFHILGSLDVLIAHFEVLVSSL